MVYCNECTTEVNAVSMENVLWCTRCGVALKDDIKWTFSYANLDTRRYSRPQYSRLKRFIEYIRTFKSDSLSINLEPILDLFYLLENGWHKNKYGRTYFYCKNIVLHALILRLGITDVMVPLLKDDTRNTKQLAEIVIIMNGETK